MKSKISCLPEFTNSTEKEGEKALLTDVGKTSDISLCMIVKNEEKNLARCLSSIKKVVDEIIIVDTGSTDRTVGIANQFGAKIYYHSWEGSFSAARNYSLKYASCKWVLILDADEELCETDAPQLRSLIQNTDCEAITLVIKNRSRNSTHEAYTNSLRLFRNFRGTHYKGSIHNVVVYQGRCFISPLRIIHHGYNLAEDKMKEKFLRTASMLREQINKDPQNPVLYRYLGVACLDRGRYDDAVKESKKALELAGLKKCESKEFLVSYYVISAGYYGKGRLKESEFYALRSVELDNKFLDGFCVLSFVYYRLKRYDKFLEVSETYLKLWDKIAKYPERFQAYTFNTMGHKWRIHLYQGFNYLTMNQEDKGYGEIEKAILESVDTISCLKLIGNFYLENNFLVKAEETFVKVLKDQESSAEALFKIGLIRFKQRCFEESLMYLRKAVEIKPTSFDIRLMICRINIVLERFEDIISDCSLLLKDLKLLRNITLENFTDLSVVFKSLGERLSEMDNLHAAETAFKISDDLKRYEYPDRQYGRNMSVTPY